MHLPNQIWVENIYFCLGQLKELLMENRDGYIMGEVGGGKGLSQADMDTIG